MSPNESGARRVLGGAAIIVMLLGLALFIVSLDELLRSREGSLRLVGVFPEARGVQPGTDVWLAGRQVGQVESVSLLRPTAARRGVVALDIRLPADLRPLLRRDSEIRMAAAQPLSPPVVRIVPGSIEAPPLEEGDTLWAVEVEFLRPLAGRLPSLRAQGDSLLGSIGNIAEQLDASRRRLEPLFASASALTTDLDELDRMLERGQWGETFRGEGLALAIGQVRAGIGSLRLELRRLSPAARDSAAWAEARHSLGERLRQVRTALASLDSLAGSPGGSGVRFRQDPAIQRELAETRAALDSLFAELRRAPHRLFF